MQFTTLPGTGISVSRLCLGTMTFGSPVAEPDAIRLVHDAAELGVNFIDTANMYEGYNRFAGSAGGVAGIKVSDWNIFLIRRIKADYPEKIVYTGLDEMVVPGLLYGADGSIGTWINLLPEFYCKLWTLAQAGRCTELNRLQTAYTEFLRKGWQFGILNAFQELMRSLGYAEKCFRAPAVWQPGSMPEPLLQELLADLDGLNALAASMS